MAKVRRRSTSGWLFIVGLYIISAVIGAEWNQALAEDVHGAIITSGEYISDTEYRMKAWGKDIFSHETHSGDWEARTIDGTSFRLADAWAKYYFKIPAELYDERQIVSFRVEVSYDNVDYADVNGGNENAPPNLLCYDWENNNFDFWGNLQATGDGNVKWKKVTTPGLYPGDPSYHIASSGGEKYQIHIAIDAPDGDGGAPGDDDAEVDIDEVYVYLQVKKPIFSLTSSSSANIGDVYVETNSTTTNYNKARKKQFTFQNTGESGSVLRWSISKPTSATWLKLSETSGTLSSGQTKTVDVWAEGVTLNPGHYDAGLTLRGDRVNGGRVQDQPLNAHINVYRTNRFEYLSPEVSPLNNRVNIALASPVSFEVGNEQKFNPYAQVVAYRWAKVAAGATPTTYSQTTGRVKNYDGNNFPDPGGYDIYCKSVEEAHGIEVESDPIKISVRAWARPTVEETPPQSAIDAGDVSWYGSRYAGVTGEPVRFMADGNVSSQNDESTENIAKYLWYLDDQGETVELTQWPGQAVSYTWGTSNLSGRIRCKAVTNYGVESDEKLFDLRVYQALQADPRGTYTGRPNTSVRLQGFVDKNSYPGATFEYQWQVNVPVLKNAAVQTPDYVELTPNVGSRSGQLEYTDLQLGDTWSVTGEFWSGGGSGADAFYIYVWADDTPPGEGTAKGNYSIAYDEYNSNGEIQLIYDGTRLATVVEGGIDNSQWRSFQVDFAQGNFDIYLDGILKLQYDDSANYQDRMTGHLFGFGARTGGLNNYHRVRNPQWYRNGEPVSDQQIATDGNGRAEFEWAQDGTYPVKFSVRVNTSEGLELRDTQIAEVIIESGKPTALPGGPYRGGIAGGNYSPVPFEGNSPDYVEAADIGHIVDWEWTFNDPNADQQGVVGRFYEYPTDLADQSTLNLDIVENYLSDNKTDPTLTRSYGTIDFPSTSGDFRHRDRAGEETGVSNYFLARFTGFIQIETAGTYEFHVTSDEGFRLKIDDAIVAEDPNQRAIAETTGSHTFAEPGNYPIELSYFERLGDAALKFSWTPTGGTKALVPAYTLSTGGFDAGRYNPGHAYARADTYPADLRVRSEYGKWSLIASTQVEVIDGTIAGYVRAADLRTPVREVTLTLTSSHVSRNALARMADADDRIHTTANGSLQTVSDPNGYYAFEHLPLGNYRIIANKGEGDSAHEFEKRVLATELTLDGPNQLAIDFVDLSVYPVGGRVVYSIQKNGQDVLVEGVKIKAQPVGSTSDIEALLSTRSLSATGTNYSMPLFAGKYLFLAEKYLHDIRLAGTHPNDTVHTPPPGYDSNAGLITIEDARTDIDFVDYKTYELSVFVVDSGENAITHYPDNYSNAGAPITVTVSGDNGQASDVPVDEDGKIAVKMNPGVYTVTVEGASPESEEIDLTGGDRSMSMTIPVKIELEITSLPPALIPHELWNQLLEDDEIAQFMADHGIDEDNIPEGYLYYYPPDPIPHVYTIKATANGQPVTGYILTVSDEISQMTPDPPTERDILTSNDESEVDVRVVGGLPKLEFDQNQNPVSGEKTITFKASKAGYEESDLLETGVKILGDLPKGAAEQIIAIPNVNYTVLHDPPGDGSYSYLDDSAVIRGAIQNMTISYPDPGGDSGTIPVYPAPWSNRDIEGYDDGDIDLGRSGLLDTRGSKSAFDDDYDSAADNYMINVGMRFGIVGGKMAIGALARVVLPRLSMKLAKWAGPAAAIASYPLSLAFAFKDAAILKEGPDSNGYITPQIQYEVRPRQRMQTPSGDTVPDLVGPGKGDIYIGEGWTLLLRDHYRFGILWNDATSTWDDSSTEVKTYTVERNEENQYMYTVRDIEQIVSDLTVSIESLAEGSDERKTLESSRATWQQLLNYNLAYRWNKYYVDNAAKIAMLEAKSSLTPEEQAYLSELQTIRDSINAKGGDPFEAFKEGEGLTNIGYETLLFSGGPTFEYSRSVSEGNFATYTVSSFYYDRAKLGSTFAYTMPPPSFVPIPVSVRFEIGGGDFVGKEDRLTNSVQSGQQVEQTVGFVLNDDDVGDQFATHVYEDLRWGTPMFIQSPGSYTSDPWEAGTSKAVDITLELVEQPGETFDYHEGGHYTIKVTYTGARYYQGARDVEGRTLQTIDFALYAPQPDNADSLTVQFNGTHEPYIVSLNQDMRSATIVLSLYPPEKDRDNTAEKAYEVDIMVQEVADRQIARLLNLTPTFADMRAPRAVITAPYSGERISPVFFPGDQPFKIKTLSEDTDLNTIQLQIRSRQPDGVWEPWYNLSGMLWEDGGTNTAVTVFDRLNRRPPRREFTFQWAEGAIRQLGVGEYALRAIATDKATNPNTDIDPPFVLFLVDDAKPSVLNCIPDYQARESERIYRGELSVTFTDDMRATDFDDRTFYVMDLLDNNSKVSGYVSYSPALRKTVFVPIVPFRPNGFYRVEVKTDVDNDQDGNFEERGVHDLAGNPLDNAFMWTFRTTDAPFEPTWSMVFSATDGDNTDGNNIAAVAYGAIDAEDEKDVRAVPALASQMRMSFLNRDKVEFDRDIRPADGRLAHHWFFVVDNAGIGSTVTLSWQPSLGLAKTTRQYQIIRLVEFDRNGGMSNSVTLDPTLAMNQQTGLTEPVVAYTYTNQGERSRYFRLDAQKVGFAAGTFEVGTSGWRFFSVPITPQRAEPFVNLGDDIDPFQLFQYETDPGGYKVYPYDLGEVSLQTAYGYFTRLAKDVEVDVGGTSNYNDVTIALEDRGWHAIGNPFSLPVNVSDLLLNGLPFDDVAGTPGPDDEYIRVAEDTLYRWNIITRSANFLSGMPLSDSYQSIVSGDPLQPWEGYWIKTRQDNVMLTIPVPPGLGSFQPPVPEYLRPPMAPTRIADSGVQSAEWEEGFRLSLKLASASASDLTTLLGTHPKATAGPDGLDQSEPPMLSKTVAAYFEHANWDESAGLYNSDFQATMEPGESRTWQLTLYTDQSDATMTLSWEDAVELMPEDTMFRIRRAESGVRSAEPVNSSTRNSQPATGEAWIDMRDVTSLKFAATQRITEIPLEIRAERFAMAPPADVQVVAGERQVTVRWRAEESAFVSGYSITRDGSVVARLEGSTLQVERSTFQRSNVPTGANAQTGYYEYTDTSVLEESTYTYQMTVHYVTGAELSSEPFTVTVLPFIKETVLLPSYPNPFNPDTWIPYELVKEADVSIDIYNSTGRLVRTLKLGKQPRGRYVHKDKAGYWDGRTRLGERVASGVYFYVLKAGDFTATRKMVIRK